MPHFLLAGKVTYRFIPDKSAWSYGPLTTSCPSPKLPCSKEEGCKLNSATTWYLPKDFVLLKSIVFQHALDFNNHLNLLTPLFLGHSWCKAGTLVALYHRILSRIKSTHAGETLITGFVHRRTILEAFVAIWGDERSSQLESTHSEASLPCFKPWLCPLLGSSHTQDYC